MMAGPLEPEIIPNNKTYISRSAVILTARFPRPQSGLCLTTPPKRDAPRTAACTWRNNKFMG